MNRGLGGREGEGLRESPPPPRLGATKGFDRWGDTRSNSFADLYPRFNSRVKNKFPLLSPPPHQGTLVRFDAPLENRINPPLVSAPCFPRLTRELSRSEKGWKREQVPRLSYLSPVASRYNLWKERGRVDYKENDIARPPGQRERRYFTINDFWFLRMRGFRERLELGVDTIGWRRRNSNIRNDVLSTSFSK